MKRRIDALVMALFAGSILHRSTAGEETVHDARFSPEFEAVIRSDSLLMSSGGARVIRHQEKNYFIAIGVTPVFPDSPRERLRRLTVGEAKALREAAEFIEPTEVSASTAITDSTEIVTTPRGKSAKSRKTIDERIHTAVQAILRRPATVGTWQNADRSLFFYAIGAELDAEVAGTGQKANSPETRPE